MEMEIDFYVYVSSEIVTLSNELHIISKKI